MSENIYSFIKEEETKFKLPIEVISGWNWNFYEHCRQAILYKNSQFTENNDYKKSAEGRTPFKNVIRFILNTHYRTEGFNVSDIEIFIDNAEKYFKSFLLRKYHERWALENQIDTFIDKLVESYVDYGLALVKNVKGAKPEVVELSTLAFCNQKDILSRPFGIKHYFSPDELLEMADSGWGDSNKGATISLEDLIVLTENESKKHGGDIEIYEVHGVMPEKWINDKKQESKKYVRQVQICAYYKNQEDESVGITLFKSNAPKKLFKALKRDEVPNRAAGFGGVEELTDAQIWTNYAKVRQKDFLDSASKTLLKTTDSGLVNRHPTGFKNLDNLEVIQVADGKDVSQIDTFPRNYQVFNASVQEWEDHARTIGFANEPLLGEPAPSGTPFRAQERQVIEGKGIHEYRKEKIARFVEEIYREWIMPHLKREVANGAKFLSELSSEELESVADNVSIRVSNQEFINQVLEGKLPSKEELTLLREQTKADFLRQGNKRFMEILKDEFADDDFEPRVDVAGKVRDLGVFVDKLSGVFRTIFSNPILLQDPRAVKLLNTILENSGFSPIKFDFSSALALHQQQTAPPLPSPAPQIPQNVPLTA